MAGQASRKENLTNENEGLRKRFDEIAIQGALLKYQITVQ